LEALEPETRASMAAPRHYLHGDYLEPIDRRPGSVVYCAFCDGYCLPEHLSDEHKVAENRVRLDASRKVFYRTRQRAERPLNAPNYLDGSPDPG
jgi:hypothetical protein